MVLAVASQAILDVVSREPLVAVVGEVLLLQQLPDRADVGDRRVRAAVVLRADVVPVDHLPARGDRGVIPRRKRRVRCAPALGSSSDRGRRRRARSSGDQEEKAKAVASSQKPVRAATAARLRRPLRRER